MTDRYVVSCDCAGPRAIATIIDERSDGGAVTIVPTWVDEYTIEWADTPRNRRGDHTRAYRLHCEGCRRDINAITDSTAAAIIDKIRPLLAAEHTPIPSGLADKEWVGDLLDAVGGPHQVVIPFALFCAANTRIGENR